jgi:ribosome maturation factor RimP
MITEEQIRTLADQYLEGSENFVVDTIIKPGNRIMVFIDGDQRVSVEACIRLSRYLESQFDRDSEDFDLTVSSSGADRPLKLPRQFRKNIGFQLEVIPKEGEKMTGTVLQANDSFIELEVTISGKKKKETEKSILTLKYSDIKSAKEVITFKKQ